MSEKTARKEQYPRNAQQTRARILKVAAELFSQASYDNVRSRDIAQKAGVDVALINRYFGSKKELFKEVFEHFLVAPPAIATGDSLEERICKVFEMFFNGQLIHDEFDSVNLFTLSVSSPEVGGIVAEYFQNCITEIAGNFSTEAARTLSTSLLMYIAGARMVFRILPAEERERLDKEVMLEPIRSLFREHSKQGNKQN
jgi:AcrR family transcriptional regulator